MIIKKMRLVDKYLEKFLCDSFVQIVRGNGEINAEPKAHFCV
jgi:hypothetical protein